MPLTMAKVGETNRIRKITGTDDVCRHLQTLGLVAGETVTIITELAGNIILEIKDTRVALDKALVSRIMI